MTTESTSGAQMKAYCHREGVGVSMSTSPEHARCHIYDQGLHAERGKEDIYSREHM